MNIGPNCIGKTDKVQKNCTFFISDLNKYSDDGETICYDDRGSDSRRKCTKEITSGFKRLKKIKNCMYKNPYILQPKIKPIIAEGRLSYNENVRCNNILRFKKEIREEFEGLQGNNQLIGYRMEYYRNEEELQNRLTQVINDKIGLPFLLFLFKNDKGGKES